MPTHRQSYLDNYRFPKYLWCQLVPQTVLILNMLWQSQINKKLYVHNQAFGTFNCQRTPLAPLGTKVLIHENQTRDQIDHIMNYYVTWWLIEQQRITSEVGKWVLSKQEQPGC